MKNIEKDNVTTATGTDGSGSFGEKLAKNVGTSALVSAILTILTEGVKVLVKVLRGR